MFLLQMREAARQDAPSRGALPVDFVSGGAAPEEFLSSLAGKVWLHSLLALHPNSWPS
jgi:hypothetical protein